MVFLYSSTCQAGLLFEPYGGWNYSFGGTKESTPETTVSYSNWDVGLRLGWVWKTFMFGADGDYKRTKVKFEQNGVTTEPKFDVGNIGVFLGAWLPLNLNFRAGYIIISEWREVDGDEKYRGNGFNLGVGFKFFIFAINVDYRMYWYHRFENVADTSKLNINDILLTLSIPLNIGG